jgi:hypothetical protein
MWVAATLTIVAALTATQPLFLVSGGADPGDATSDDTELAQSPCEGSRHANYGGVIFCRKLFSAFDAIPPLGGLFLNPPTVRETSPIHLGAELPRVCRILVGAG